MAGPGPSNYLENAIMGEGSSIGRAADPRLRALDQLNRSTNLPIPPADMGVARGNASRILRALMGQAEGLAHGVSSMAAQVPAGLAGLHDLIGAGLDKIKPVTPAGDPDGLGAHMPDPAGTVDRVQRALTYDPKTQEGTAALENAREAPAVQGMQWLFQDLPEKAGTKMQDMGLPAALAAAVTTGLEVAPNLLGEETPTGTLKALRRGGKKVLSTMPWDKMTLEQAQAAAAAGEHLQRGARGQYVGAPRGVNTPGKLDKMTAGVDADVAKGAFGADWYERARAAVSEMAGDDPAKVDELSRMLALYSPVAMPDVNMGHAIKQANDVILKGDKSTAKPYMPYQAEKGREIMAGGNPWLGDKVGVYESHINPNKAEESKVRGVNDIWMGRSYDYPGVDGQPFERGFSEAEHSFLTGENLRAAQRAKDAGILPEGVDPNVGTVQAAGWVGNRYQEYLDEKKPHFDKLFAKGDLEGALKLDEEMKRKASASYDAFLPKYSGAETHELVSGRNSGHMSRAADLPMSKKKELTSLLEWAKPGERDPVYEALGMYQRPVPAEGLGQFTETVKKPALEAAVRDPETGKIYKGPTHAQAFESIGDDKVQERIADAMDRAGAMGDSTVTPLHGFVKNPDGEFLGRRDAKAYADQLAGRKLNSRYYGSEPYLASEDLHNVPQVDTQVTDYNPSRTARPMVAYDAKTGGFDPASASLLEQTNAFRSVMDAQDAGAYGAVNTAGGNTGDAARVTFKQPLSERRTRELYQRVADAGLNLVDTGGGTFKVTKFLGPEGERMSPTEFGQRLKKLNTSTFKGVAEVERGGHVGGYQDVPWGASESGQATDWLMGKVDPRVGEKLTSTDRVRKTLLRKNENELKFKKENPFDVGAPREDLQRLRSMVATHGLEGVRAMIKKAGGGVKGAAQLGLPAVALTYLSAGGDDEAR